MNLDVMFVGVLIAEVVAFCLGYRSGKMVYKYCFPPLDADDLENND